MDENLESWIGFSFILQQGGTSSYINGHGQAWFIFESNLSHYSIFEGDGILLHLNNKMTLSHSPHVQTRRKISSIHKCTTNPINIIRL